MVVPPYHHRSSRAAVSCDLVRGSAKPSASALSLSPPKNDGKEKATTSDSASALSLYPPKNDVERRAAVLNSASSLSLSPMKSASEDTDVVDDDRPGGDSPKSVNFDCFPDDDQS